MPEGPSIVILKEEVQAFKNKKVIKVTGNSKVNFQRASNQKIIDFKSWGKHFLVCFNDFTIRIHFMLFGSYSINEDKSATPRLSLHFKNGALSFYACSVILIEEPLDEAYDWSEDIMSDKWDAAAAKKKIKSNPDMLMCDALLNQHIFSGSGNIIKNEVLFRVRVHPLSKCGKLPVKQLNQLVKETRNYAFDFLEWKKKHELKKHWLAYAKKICPRCNIPLVKEYLGQTHRRTFFCNNCQEKYG
ncbi:MAG: endonuclease [Agriterribacter sp.]